MAKKVDSRTLDLILDEVEFARTKFPGGKFLLAALTEEVGELAKALLQKSSKDDVIGEAVQVAAMAIRIIEEGCPEFDDLTEDESKV